MLEEIHEHSDAQRMLTMNDSDSHEDENISDETFGDDNEDDEILWELSPIHFSPENRKIRDLLAADANQELDARPKFQRDYVWDRKTASRLVESVLLNVPLPIVYTAAEEEEDKEVVIDGKQRLLSLFGFIRDEFPSDKKSFKLTGLKTKTASGKALNGKRFKDLEPKHQNKIKNSTIPIIKIEPDSDANVRFEIFERLNSGAVKLNAQELRNCIYRGRFNEFLLELAESKKFRTNVGEKRALSRMKDAELVLRFLMFGNMNYTDYQGQLKPLLNDFMERHQKLDDKRKEEFSGKFKQATDLSFSVFGKNAFRRFQKGDEENHNGQWDNRFNRALFDVVMWGFTQYEKRKIIDNSNAIREALIRLSIEDERFKNSVTFNTGGKEPVKYRFSAWERQLKEILGSKNAQKEKRVFSPDLKRKLFDASPTCSLCKNEIQDIDDAEVDHITPYSNGGVTDPSNAQLTHRYCNRAKSNKEF